MSDGNYYDERERQDELEREAMLEQLRQQREQQQQQAPPAPAPQRSRAQQAYDQARGHMSHEQANRVRNNVFRQETDEQYRAQQAAATTPAAPEAPPVPPTTGGQANETPVPPQQKYDVKLGGFDMSKLGDAEHYKTHPKYAVARLLNSGNYNYTTEDMGRMLKDLQADENTKHMFEGWEAHRDGIRHTGGGPRYEAWGDTDWVDLMADWGGQGKAKDFWWGANDNNPANDPKQPGLMRAQMPGVGFGPSSFQSIQQLAPTDTDFFNTLQAQLQDILGPASFDREALLQLLGRK